MNKRIDLTLPGGFPIDEDMLGFMQSSYRDAISGLAGMAGNNRVIVSGMQEVGANVSAGWIMMDGELIPFLAGAKQPTFIIEEEKGTIRFLDGNDKEVYFTKRARFGSGVTQYAYADLRRIGSQSFMQDTESFATARALKRLAGLSLYEETVIIAGCEVSNVTPASCTIAAGKVLVGETYFETPAYNGAYPVWITSAGVFVTAVPAGLSIKFDPHTSQRKADVLRRAMHQSGQIIMSKVVLDRFDLETGVGKWEWLGWKLSEDLRGCSPVGLWFGDNGLANEYDPVYRDITHKGGSKDLVISKANLPPDTIDVPIVGGDTSQNDDGTGRIAMGGTGNDGGPYPVLKTAPLGDGTPMDNRSRFKVTAFIERI